MTVRLAIGFVFLILSGLASQIDARDYYVSLGIATTLGVVASAFFISALWQAKELSTSSYTLFVTLGVLAIVAIFFSFLFFREGIGTYKDYQKLAREQTTRK